MTTDMKTMQLARECQTDAAAVFRRAQLSALADGQLRGAAFGEALALFEHDNQEGGQARATWHTLHVVGDVLRATELAACHKDGVFLTRLTAALQQEPGLKPSMDATLEAVHMGRLVAGHLEPGETAAPMASANEPTFRWKWVAGLSSVAAALAISWNLVGGTAATSGVQLAQIAASPSASIQAAAPAQVADAVPHDAASPAMLRNPQLDAMIAAHSQLGGSSALQMPSGFLRSATFNGAAR